MDLRNVYLFLNMRPIAKTENDLRSVETCT